MLSAKLSILFLVIFLLFRYSKTDDSDEDYDIGEDANEYEDCEYEVDFKVYKKSPKLDLCNALKTPSPSSHIQLQVYANHTNEKIQLRASSRKSHSNKSLISLTTDITEDFKHPTSLLTIDNYQLLSLTTVQSILSSIINIDLKLLSKNLKKTLILLKGGKKTII